MGRQLPSGIYQGVNFASKGAQYERAYRMAAMETVRFFKAKRGPFRRITKWWPQHTKAKPGPYRRHRRLRNDYVQSQD